MTSRGLAEIVLIVEDVPAAARFYEDVVGLTPAHREQRESKGALAFTAGRETERNSRASALHGVAE